MTYIAGFTCRDGIVMCADTMETVGDYKNYVEKLVVIEDLSYPLSIGGAGLGDLVDVVIAEVIERAKAEKPRTRAELKTLIQTSLKIVFEQDLPSLVVPKQLRSPEFLIAASTEDGPAIFFAKGRRVINETARAIIGYGTQYNNELLKRLHRPTLSMQQAVLIAIYLVSQSKKLDADVNGETRVAVVTKGGAWIDYQPYVDNSESRITDFLRLIDALFLSSVDITVRPSEFPEILNRFGNDVSVLRQRFLDETSAIMLGRLFSGGGSFDPYQKIFVGAVVELGTFGTRAREDTPEELERRRQMIAALKERSNQVANAEFNSMILNRVPLYLGEERVQVRGTAGFIESGSS